MGLKYYATKISENISKTPEGYLLCRNCVLARTGFQEYTVEDVIKDLDDESIKELGLDTARRGSRINLYRPAEEVFKDSTVASAQGKTFTDEHPEEFVSPENFREHARGHITNARKGTEVLESGDWPMLGDILVTDAEAIEKIDRGIRELSCGYSHELEKRGDKICQVNIVINHVALVRKGRAGPEARINDAADESAINCKDNLVEEEKSVAKEFTDVTVRLKSRERKMAKTKDKKDDKSTFVKRLLGKAMRSLALDTEVDDEDLMDGFAEVHEKMKDSEEEMVEKTDSKSKDCVCGGVGCAKCGKKDEFPMEEKKEEKEVPAMDADRQKFHDMLDKVMDEMGMGKEESQDDGVEELKKLINEHGGGEKKAEEPGEEMPKEESPVEEEEDAEESGILEPIEEEDSEESEKEKEEKMVANDAAIELLPFVEKAAKRTKDKKIMSSYDSALTAALDDEKIFLRKFKPIAAKSKDKELISATNAQIVRVNGQSKATDEGVDYMGFGVAAKKTIAKRKDTELTHEYDSLEKAYAARLNGEVK